MEILKTIFTMAPALKSINYKERAGMIYYKINASKNEWGKTFM